MSTRRVWLASSGVESWTVIGPDHRPVGVVEEFLAWLTWIERSPNTVEAYARDLRVFWTFLAARGAGVGCGHGDGAGRVRGVGAAAGRERRRAERAGGAALRAHGQPDADGVVGFYEFQARRGNRLARELVVQTRGGRGDYKPFLHGIARAAPRGRPVRLREQQRRPRTLTLEQVAAVIDAQRAACATASCSRCWRAPGCASARRSRCATRTSWRGSGGSRSSRARAIAAGRAARAARAGRFRSRAS